ncbi:S8 family serine peptidase [Arthrobacter sp. NEB 688]|uniref:S8 family serine peptidase n=1 Tax=Arthrobacter sp. NEB 688 TaxID=904039 RepID=UPI001566CD16|nr:S8 family serine peptidase [Arthrobacter sp. NEB 688]QKE83266.1 S8 family serine peptidase [Arthrobacter sp. NEB 688]
MRHPLTHRSGRVALAGLAAAALTTGSFGAAGAVAKGPGDPGALREKAPQATLQKTEVKETPSASTTEKKLGQHDVQLLEKAQSAGTKRVTLILAVDKGTTKQVAASIRAQGGFVGMTNDKVGYVRASVPTKAVPGVAALAKVRAVDLDESVKLPAPGTEGKAGAAKAVAAPGKSTPDANPYMPTRETGSTTFKKANPKWDGRGVTIGVLDSGVDLDHPALATTSTGERKIVDWVTATDPIFDDDATWRPMLTEVEADPTFEASEQTWTAPKSGTFLYNRFSESITAASEPGGDVNRDGDTTDRFGILYDADTHDIWVDANQDNVFSDDELMRPYNEKYDVGHFGTDDPDTDIVESMPFVVEYREDVDLSPYGGPYVGQKADYVNIGIVEDAHGSHVAGIAAGHSLFGGAMDGQAPGAKVVSSRACTWGGGCTNAALTDGMVDLVANRGVDVVNMSIGGLPALNDGANARAELYNRLIDVYGVQLFISAGNSGAGINTVGDPSVATDVVSVASSVSKETWLANYGSEVSSKLALHNYSSRGPREDGGFKPNIMAPGSAISTVPQWLKQPDLAEAGYELPVGYAMFNGTSMASPQAAGAAALLLSAGFQTKTPITPKQLRESMYTSADYQKSLEAVGQGTGQADVPGAWALLKAKPTVRGEYSTSAAVCTALADFLVTPKRGTGLYLDCPATKGGLSVNKAKTYTVKVTRSTGSGKAIKHNVRIIGNDGTFSAQSSVSINRGTEARIPVTMKARTTGLHSAILEIDDPTTKLVDHRIMLAVVASQDVAKPSYSTVTRGSVQRNLFKRVFVTVPEGAKAFQVNLSGIATKSQVRWIAFNPYGVPVDSTSTPNCYTNYSDPSVCKPQSRAYANPIPGVWELLVESRRTSPFLDNPFVLTAAVQGLTVDPETQTVDAPVGESTPVSWTVKNDFGPVTVTPRGGSLGSAHAERATIAEGDTASYEVVVPQGATRLDAAIGNTSDLSADLDLTVFDADGNQVAQSADGDSEEAVSIANPAPGTYTVEIDGYAVPAGTTQFDYRDVFFSPALGTLDVPSGSVTLAGGATVTVNGAISPDAAAGNGRQLFGEMNLLSPEGAVLGTGSVLVSAPAQS